MANRTICDNTLKSICRNIVNEVYIIPKVQKLQ
jgi:hypothetical protein